MKVFLLGAILLLAFVVRAIDLNGQSLFIDEFSEISHAKNSVTEIIYANDSAPPLFPIALKAWIAFWQTDASARWFSVVCGVASVLCVWGIGRRLVDDATGLAAAFVTAILPMHVFYSQFVRCYSLMFLCVALDLWLLLRALDRDRIGDWIAFVVVAVLGAYTHYYFVIFLPVSILVICWSRHHWWIGKRAVAAYAAVGIAMLPLLWLLPGDLAFQKGLRDPRPLNAATFGYTYFSIFNGYTLGPSTSELQTMTARQAIRGAAPWAAAVGVILLVLGYAGWRRLRGERSLLVILALGVLPVAILGFLSIAGGLNYNVRFVTWIMIAAAVWLGAGIAAGRRQRLVQLACAALILLSALAFYNHHWVARYEEEDLRGAASYLHAHATTNDTVYVVSDYLADLMRYYLGDKWHVVELPSPGNVNHVVHNNTDARQAADLATDASGRQAWLIYSRPFHGDPEGLLLKTLESRDSLELAATCPGVAIYRGEHPHVAAK
ncbi:MAG TPA: glycosyltransferase family 39 protein [Lacipirellulaceae bacterium]|nr:glycosyltransferase family 39 protein [Lacipirellulaceae bacterium]